MTKKQILHTNTRGIRIFRKKTHSARQTCLLAKQIAKELGSNTLVQLIGELGSGKTTFTKGLAAGLSSSCNVVSPSFVLQKVYFGRLPLYHIDLYRLKGPIQTEELFEPIYGEGVWVVEWAEKLPPNFSKNKNCLKVKIKHSGGTNRNIMISTNLTTLNI